MGLLQGIFKARDKPQNTLNSSWYTFFFGTASSGKDNMGKEVGNGIYFALLSNVSDQHSVQKLIRIHNGIP